MNNQFVTWVSPLDLKEGGAAQLLYSKPENYQTVKENIEKMGILTPLHVVGNVVVSGNLRLQIAKELGHNEVPVLFVSPQDISDDFLAISYGQQREKKYSEILKEYEILEREFPLRKGTRTDLNPKMKENAEKRKSIKISKSKLSKLRRIKKNGKEIYGSNSNDYKKMWEKLDNGKVSLDRLCSELKRKMALKENELVIPHKVEVNTPNAKIFNKSCSDMSEIKDKSIACIITSPPYFQMRDYGTGKDQRGMENDITSYIKGLINDFKDCYRVLNEKGSLWVNVNEPATEGQYNVIPHRFAIEMIKEGWILNDELIWAKNNPVYTQARRSIRSHEYFFHFVKSKNYYYDISWLTELTDSDNRVSFGTSKQLANLNSTMDFRGSMIRTNANNMDFLRKSCKKIGFNLTHSAGFPISIPLIAILTTSKIGDTILDLFSGTATSGEAALATKRKYVGYEIKSEFIKASEVRLSPYIKDFENSKLKQVA
jgi:hypothetical protein